MNVWASLTERTTAPAGSGTIHYMDDKPVRAKRGPPQRRRYSIDNPWHLTSCQCQVVQLTADGLSNVEIAAALGITLSSVEPHMQRIKRKMGGVNRVQAAIQWDRFMRAEQQ